MRTPIRCTPNVPRYHWWLGVGVIALALTACVPAASPAPPTRTPPPTFTPTPQEAAPVVDPNAAATAQALATTQAAQQAPVEAPPPAEGQPPAQSETDTQPVTDTQTTTETAPVETPTPEPTPTPQVAEVIVNSDINVRGGPGTNYNILGAASQGQRFPVTGKNPAGDWWQINYNGQAGWVFGQLVTAQNTAAVQVAQNIPAPPPVPPTNTPAPPPPAEQPAPPPEQPAEQQEQPPAQPPPDSGNYPFQLLNTERCDPNEGNTYFNGYIRYKDNSPRNGVCVHIAFYGPRNTKCSGCDGVGDGFWGFSPFGGPADPGTTVEIFVVTCPGPMPMGGQTEQTGFGDLTPQSPKWVRTIQQSEQCTGITFVGD
jgi:uncharacterized protein YraI